MKIWKKKHTFICSSVGDPHYQTFSKINFNYYKPGDWILARSKAFKVSTRTRKWGAAAVNVRIVAVVNKEGEKVEIKASAYDKVKINNKNIVNIPIGTKHSFFYGGNIIRKSESLFQITSSNGDILEAYTFNMGAYGKSVNAPYIMNLYLKSSKADRYTGLCSASNSIIKSNDFSKEYINNDKNFKPKECTGLIRDEIEKRCNRFKAGFLRFGCIVDICSNIPVEIEKKAEKEKEKIRDVNLNTPGVEIDRRRIDASTLNPGNSNMCISWGDPHFTTFQGTKFNNYFLGDHLLLKTKKVYNSSTSKKMGRSKRQYCICSKNQWCYC